MGLKELMRATAEKVFGITKREEADEIRKKEAELQKHIEETSGDKVIPLLIKNQERSEKYLRQEERKNLKKELEELKAKKDKCKSKSEKRKIREMIRTLEQKRHEKLIKERGMKEVAKEYFINPQKKRESQIKEMKYEPEKYNSPAAKTFNLAKLDEIKDKHDDDVVDLKEKEEIREEKEEPGRSRIKDKEEAEPDMFSDTDSAEESVSHAINTLKAPENIKHFTELNDSEIKNLSALAAINNCTIKSKAVIAFIDEFVNMRVSLSRQGRGEMVGIATAAFTGQVGDILAKSAMSKMIPAGLQKYMK